MGTASCDVCGGEIDLSRFGWTILATKQLIHYSSENLDCYERNRAMAKEQVTHVKKWFTADEYQALLVAVKEKCTTEKQLQFVGMLTTAFGKYGPDAILTVKQKEWLERLRG